MAVAELVPTQDDMALPAHQRELGDVIKSAVFGHSVAERTRALFALKANGTPIAREKLALVMRLDSSALVRHEAAYLLGQLGHPEAIPKLRACIDNESEHPMVRHEAAEALGAIGDPSTLPYLKMWAMMHGAPVELRQTCKIAAERLEWLQNGGDPDKFRPYQSVDPTPAAESTDLDELGRQLADESRPLYERYQALFALRNIGGPETIPALAMTLKHAAGDRMGALLRHEVAFVMGQMREQAAVDALGKCLGNEEENEMVRHEAAEALGSIGSKEANNILFQFRDDPCRVVRESVAVALDIADYNNSSDLHYAPPAKQE